MNKDGSILIVELSMPFDDFQELVGVLIRARNDLSSWEEVVVNRLINVYSCMKAGSTSGKLSD